MHYDRRRGKILLSDLNRGYNTPYSSAEQATIERLYYEVLGKRLSGCRCPDKWHDAVLEINSYIKNTENEREIELQTACRGYSANRRVFGNLHER